MSTAVAHAAGNENRDEMVCLDTVVPLDGAPVPRGLWLPEMQQAWDAHTAASLRMGMAGVRFDHSVAAASRNAAAARYQRLYDNATAAFELWRFAKRAHTAETRSVMLARDASLLHGQTVACVVSGSALVCGRCTAPVTGPVAQRRWCGHWCYIDARALRFWSPEATVPRHRWLRRCDLRPVRASTDGGTG